MLMNSVSAAYFHWLSSNQAFQISGKRYLPWKASSKKRSAVKVNELEVHHRIHYISKTHTFSRTSQGSVYDPAALTATKRSAGRGVSTYKHSLYFPCISFPHWCEVMKIDISFKIIFQIGKFKFFCLWFSLPFTVSPQISFHIVQTSS